MSDTKRRDRDADDFRRIPDPAENRMRTRTAREQFAALLQRRQGPDEIPDADDASAWKGKD